MWKGELEVSLAGVGVERPWPRSSLRFRGKRDPVCVIRYSSSGAPHSSLLALELENAFPTLELEDAEALNYRSLTPESQRGVSFQNSLLRRRVKFNEGPGHSRGYSAKDPPIFLSRAARGNPPCRCLLAGRTFARDQIPRNGRENAHRHPPAASGL